MPEGTIKWFNVEKRFGFIIPANGGADVFRHVSNIEGAGFEIDPRGGQRVRYQLEPDRKGKMAAARLELLPT